jgi:hypothetical protein
VDRTAARRAAQKALSAATRLQEYRDYLAQVRAFKAAGAPGSPPGGASAIDHEVLAHGRVALADTRTIAGTTLGFVRTLYRSGALAAHAADWRGRVETAGTLRLADLWAAGSVTEAAREALRLAGMGDGVRQAIGAQIGALDARVIAKGSQLIVEATIGGQAVQGILETEPHPTRPATVKALLAGGRLDELTDALSVGEPIYLVGAGLDTNGAYPEDIALHGALAAVREGVRHVRKLEDAGLAVYGGGDPAVIGYIVFFGALAALVAGFILVLTECDGGTPDSTACTVGKVLEALGFLVILIMAAYEKKPPPHRATWRWAA